MKDGTGSFSTTGTGGSSGNTTSSLHISPINKIWVLNKMSTKKIFFFLNLPITTNVFHFVKQIREIIIKK